MNHSVKPSIYLFTGIIISLLFKMPLVAQLVPDYDLESSNPTKKVSTTSKTSLHIVLQTGFTVQMILPNLVLEPLVIIQE